MGVFPSLDSIMPELPKKSLVDEYNWGQSLSTATRHVDEFYDTGWVGFFNLEKILSEAIEAKASDVHITGSQDIWFTINGDLVNKSIYGRPSERVMIDLTKALLTNLQYSEFAKDKELDFSYKITRGPYSGRRFRGNVGLSQGENFLVFRVIDNNIPTLDQLKVEDELLEWVQSPDGLILLCGSTGTGKSTTLASIIRSVQLKEAKKIITIERPIEYEYPVDGNSLIIQREVGKDCRSFYDGLTAAMRQAPDIILLGEVRNNEEVSELIRAAETGHLSLSTMHTNSVATTINRIQSLFNGNERGRILSTLADSTRGIANQILLKDQKHGRFACREILTIDDKIKDMIVKGDVQGIRKHQIENKITMEYSIAKAIKDNKCTLEEGLRRTSYPKELRKALNEI